jgi:ABC-2 type transport system permease protein
MSFWTTESLEVWNAFSYGGNEAGQYPMAIYAAWFRRFFTYVIPLACVTYYPALVILGRSRSILAVAGPAAGLIFCAVSLRLWRWGVGHYRSAGS